MMLMTPFTAFAPQTVAARAPNDLDALDVLEGHILSIPKDTGEKGVYTVRPSISTSNLSEN